MRTLKGHLSAKTTSDGPDDYINNAQREILHRLVPKPEEVLGHKQSLFEIISRQQVETNRASLSRTVVWKGFVVYLENRNSYGDVKWLNREISKKESRWLEKI